MSFDLCFDCRGCLVLRHCYFDGNHTRLVDVGGGVCGCRGFHSSFRTTNGSLSLNMGTYRFLKLLFLSLYFDIRITHLYVDVSTTIIMKPGPVLEFLLTNQNIQDPRRIDWEKVWNISTCPRMDGCYGILT